MSSSSPSYPFNIIEHKIPTQHIREYPGALAGAQETVLHLAVKQYIPKDNPHPGNGDVTIIGAHANAFPKVSSTVSLFFIVLTKPLTSGVFFCPFLEYFVLLSYRPILQFSSALSGKESCSMCPKMKYN